MEFLDKELLGQVAGFVALSAYWFYAADIWVNRRRADKGTKPNRASWFMLTIVSSMIAYSYWKAGADETFWTAFAVAVGSFVTFGLSIPYGTGGWRYPVDGVCLILAAASIGIWQLGVVEDPTWLLINSLVLDLVALIPTMRHAYRAPHEELWFAWGVTVFADILTIFAVTEPTFDIVLYPVYMTIINGIVLYFIIRPWLFPKTHSRLRVR